MLWGIYIAQRAVPWPFVWSKEQCPEHMPCPDNNTLGIFFIQGKMFCVSVLFREQYPWAFSLSWEQCSRYLICQGNNTFEFFFVWGTIPWTSIAPREQFLGYLLSWEYLPGQPCPGSNSLAICLISHLQISSIGA